MTAKIAPELRVRAIMRMMPQGKTLAETATLLVLREKFSALQDDEVENWPLTWSGNGW